MVLSLTVHPISPSRVPSSSLFLFPTVPAMGPVLFVSNRVQTCGWSTSFFFHQEPESPLHGCHWACDPSWPIRVFGGMKWIPPLEEKLVIFSLTSPSCGGNGGSGLLEAISVVIWNPACFGMKPTRNKKSLEIVGEESSLAAVK